MAKKIKIKMADMKTGKPISVKKGIAQGMKIRKKKYGKIIKISKGSKQVGKKLDMEGPVYQYKQLSKKLDKDFEKDMKETKRKIRSIKRK